MLTYHRIAVVPVMVYTPLMRGIHIEPRVVRRRLVVGSVPIHRCIWMHACRMIIYNVKDYGHAPLVAGVYERLIVRAGAIRLVHSEVRMSTIAPAVVSVELLHRHQFDGIDSESFEIVKLAHGSLYAALTVCIVSKVTHQQFIYYKVILVLDVIVLNLPVILVAVDLERRHETVVPSVVGVAILLRKVRICRRRYPLIVAAVIQDLCIWVECRHRHIAAVAELVLELILLVRVQSCESDPPAAALVIITERLLRLAAVAPPVLVPKQVAEVVRLALVVTVIEDERHGAVVDYIDTML